MMAFLPKYGSVDRVVAFDPSIDDYKFELNTFEAVVQTNNPGQSTTIVFAQIRASTAGVATVEHARRTFYALHPALRTEDFISPF